MTYILSNFNRPPVKQDFVQQAQAAEFMNTLGSHKSIPWKYVLYHTLADLLGIYKPERLINPRMSLIQSLVDKVYDKKICIVDYIFSRQDEIIIK